MDIYDLDYDPYAKLDLFGDSYPTRRGIVNLTRHPKSNK